MVRKIMLLRATGFNQGDIADELRTTQATVSNYLKKIRDEAANIGVNAVIEKYIGVCR